MSLLNTYTTGEPRIKLYAIWMHSAPPPAQLDNHMLQLLGESGWQLYHVHDCAVWVAFAADGDTTHLDFSDEHKAYTSNTDDDGNITLTFDAETTMTNLVTALAATSAEDYAGYNGFIVLTRAEVKALEATDDYATYFSTSTDEEV
jgi:hypothetical protein